MATLAITHPTLADYAKTLDPDGKVARIVEILNETNEILDDMVYVEGNLPTGHRHVVRTGLPVPTWRKLYGGVQPTRSTTAQVTDNTGDLEAYAEVDKRLADLNGNTSAFRLTQDRAHLEGIAQEMSDTLFYGNAGTAPEEFTGLTERFDSASAENADNIIQVNGAAARTSIWLVVWGENKVHGIFPKASKAGIESRDMGEVTIEDIDGSGGRMQAYRSHYKVSMGLAIPDWRYVVRIAEIDTSTLVKDAASGADIVDLMTQALEIVPNLAGKPAFYCNRTIKSYLRRQIKNSNNVQISMEQVAGKHVMAFDGVPVRRCDSITVAESAVGA